MKQNQSSLRNSLWSQIREVYGRLVYSYTTHHKQVEILQKRTNHIKFVQIILSASSSCGFIGSEFFETKILTWVAGIFSIILFAVNLYCKNSTVADDISKHRKAADALWVIRESYLSLLTDFASLTEVSIMQRRDELQACTAEVYKTTPPTSPRAYAKAKKDLKDKEEQFFIDEEIDNMIHKHLRSNKPPQADETVSNSM